tara:strand:+ start:361 stop:546 length:186 start_codon:yes stop_codon:yes gene_type:complete
MSTSAGDNPCLTSAPPWDRFEDLNKGGFLVHLINYEIEMTKKPETSKDAADKVLKNIRCKT